MNSLKAIAVFAALGAASNPALSGQPRADLEPLVVATAHQVAADGEIRKVDPAAKKITIRHGELKHLDMPAMTMVFRVKDPALLDKVKAGDKVKFRADKIDGAYTIVEIEAVK